MVKIKLNNDTTADLDLSDTIISVSPLNRRVESEKPGEAGVIVFDSVSLEFPLSAFPNNDFDFTNLDNYGDYQFTIEYLLEGTVYPLFDGIMDKKSVNLTSAHTVRFDIYGRLSDMRNIFLTESRLTFLLWNRAGNPSGASWIDINYGAYDSVNDRTAITIKAYDNSGQLVGLDLNYPPLFAGDIIEDTNDDKTLVVRCVSSTEGSSVIYIGDVLGDRATATYKRYYSSDFGGWDRHFYNQNDINRMSGDYLVYYDGFKIISAFVNRYLRDIPVVNQTGKSYFDVDLSYYTDLMTDQPFGQHPLDAMIFLAQSMRLYMYIDPQGRFIIQDNFFTDTTYDLDLTTEKWEEEALMYRWDKSVDYVLVKQYGGGYDENNPATFGDYPSTMTRKPRNKLEREVILLNNSETYSNIAQEYYNFYNPRRPAAQKKTKLNPNTINVDLCKKLRLDIDGFGVYFAESLTMDLDAATVNFTAVKIA